ncbi:protein FRIGIDA-ESSENTIAL 1-like [Zingiber officinale]|uniref:protein FRIGIDA-ESSENTIAL 1-like n=1 Tax=Zingiber officinale TaxID=94328 RepID=UPI001C4BA2E1|nr:protein FRIGIDA-ESSENTIAL 1-like [Zingiber officinale]
MLKAFPKATLDSSPHPTGEVDSHAVAANGDGDAESLFEHQGERYEEDEKLVEEEQGEEMEEDEVGGGKEGEGGSDLLRDQDDDTSTKHEGCLKEPSSNPANSFVNSANSQAEYLKGGNLVNHSPSKLHIKQTSENNNDLSQPTSQRRPRSSSPCIQHESKNPAIICNFFARGWCIKGSSCKFLHKKEVVDYANQGTQEDRTTKDAIDCKGMPNVGNLTKSDFLLHRALVQTYGGETHGFSQFKDTNSQASKNDEHFQVDGTRQPKFQQNCAVTDVPYTDFSEDRYSSSVEISSRHFSSERMMYKEMPSGEHRYDASSLIKNPLTSESICSVGGSSMLLNAHNDSCDIYSIGKKPDDLARQYQPSHFTLHGSHTSGLSSSIKSKFDYSTHSLRESPAIESLHSFAQVGTRLSQGSPPVNISVEQKLQENAWETSVPFRPSFSLAPFFKPFCESQYDPFVDSIDHPKRVLTSTSPKGTLVSTDSQHTIGAFIAGDLRPGYDASKSVNSFTSASEGILVIRKEVHEYSSYTMSPGFTTKEEEKGQIPDLTNPAPVNESERRNNLRVDKVKYSMESKAMKIFHSALVEFLKELLKPSWKEGRLNKDTHKLIVKKAADKVLGVLQPHQVPNGPEAIDQYLFSSKSKLLKLVEAYVDKHSKT